ncbi:MAG: hypothetical protein ACR2JB_05205 [Bryobacteraceae bacterium]
MKHGIVRLDEFNNRVTAGELCCHIDYCGQWNPFTHQHVVDHSEHKNAVELSSGTIQKMTGIRC